MVRHQREKEGGAWEPQLKRALVTPGEWRGLPGSKSDEDVVAEAALKEAEEEHPEVTMIWQQGNEEEFVREMKMLLKEEDGLGKRSGNERQTPALSRTEGDDFDDAVDNAAIRFCTQSRLG